MIQDVSPRPTERYTDIRCDNVVLNFHSRQYQRCNRLLMRLRSGDTLNVPVEVECSKCGQRRWVGVDNMTA